MIGALLAACACALLVRAQQPRTLMRGRSLSRSARGMNARQRAAYLDACQRALAAVYAPGARVCVSDPTGTVRFLPICGAVPAALAMAQMVEGAKTTCPSLTHEQIAAWDRGVCPSEADPQLWTWGSPMARALFWRFFLALELSDDPAAVALAPRPHLNAETMQMAALCPPRDAAGAGMVDRAVEGRLLPEDAILG